MNCWIRSALALGIMVMIGARGWADDRIDFRTDVLPILTKHGCNAGACHGAALGRGNFKLSLFGSRPVDDYDAIVRQVGGRRVNGVRPENSLLLLKPTEQLAHGGELRFDVDSDAAQTITRWIAAGARFESDRRLVDVSVHPPQVTVGAVGQSIPLKAIAQFSDGTTRDVTAYTILAPDDAAALSVQDDGGSVQVLRPGSHVLVARYINRVQPIQIRAPIGDAALEVESDEQSDESIGMIDRSVNQMLVDLRLPASPKTDDEAFLRRVTLDLTGRLPTLQQRRLFLDDRRNDKRKRWIDRLLESEAFSRYWTSRLAEWFRVRSQNNDQKATEAYRDWLYRSIQDRVGFDDLVQQMLTATGDTHQVGPANFYRTAPGGRPTAELVSEVFMGSRMRCANCHDHPLDRWTQDDYHGLAAIFATVQSGPVVRLDSTATTTHPVTLQPAVPQIPGGRRLATDQPMVQTFSRWLVDDGNPYFAKAAVNRMWKHMMGRGLVDAVDDFRQTNPASHPELLQHLADDFVANGYQIRKTLHLIANSDAYQRDSVANSQNQHDDRFYSHALRRPLSPSVLADAISDVIGIADDYSAWGEIDRAIDLVDGAVQVPSLAVLGRCDPKAICTPDDGTSTGMSTMLHLFNGELLNDRIDATRGRLRACRDANMTAMQTVEQIYAAALCREPMENEKAFWVTHLDQADDQAAFLEDVMWAMVSSREFATNH
ncbi:DUF1549 and DUF1553 domain-containing protein [Crateriforma conspicua]|uniref:DUF1549 and DUF1553 domain-containing protein n=1 Tax=Crateriforma conspicua TaxID=2527996 RepID=UPI00118CFFC6|nr:DUF1549 and DUF1553 domain-containing protein [Crateriforma conspicua]QDV63940.1 hypothetical protein Mal65_30870 [Crateriforma conspicua]